MGECYECKNLLKQTCQAVEFHLRTIAELQDAYARGDAKSAASLEVGLARARQDCEAAVRANRLHLAGHSDVRVSFGGGAA